MSSFHSEAAEPAGAFDLHDWEALRWRELVWNAIPDPTKVKTIPYLTVHEVGRLDSAMTNREARPRLWESYKGMQSAAFNSYKYECREKDDHKELQWARKRSIDLRGFTIGYGGDYRSGPVLVRLMGGFDKKELNLDTATYYATRGKLTNLDEFVELKYDRHSALSIACRDGRLEMVKCLLSAGADIEKADNKGQTPLICAAITGKDEVIQLLLSAGANKNKADNNLLIPLEWAAYCCSLGAVRILVSAGADKGNALGIAVRECNTELDLDFLTESTRRFCYQEIIRLLQEPGSQA
jgi:hypothetical protein